MEKEELVRLCKYYKGEEKCPKNLSQNEAMLWFYEMGWVNHELSGYDNRNDIMEYIGAGLEDFCSDDGVPMSFKALLLNRYVYWGGSAEGFTKFYIKNYGRKNGG